MSDALHSGREDVLHFEGSPPAELPAAETKHWIPRHKATVVDAVRSGRLSLEEACERYMLTDEEFHSWATAIDRHGVTGLKASVRGRRKTPRQPISEAGAATLYANERADCLITDISDQGARLEFGRPVSLPSTFELHCEKSGRSWWVTATWQRDRVAGVRFSNPLHPPWTIKSGLAAWLLGTRQTVSLGRLDVA